MKQSQPVEVAVIGSGAASIAAAFELSRPEHRGKYRVTVYEMGWRLGGKGASGRGPADRIEEHGLHLWMGYYENAFRLLRECYAELGRDPRTCRIADWQDAFFRDPLVGLAEPAPDGTWRSWLAHFPSTDDLPGDPIDAGDSPFSLGSYLERATILLRTVLASTELSSKVDNETRQGSWDDLGEASSGNLQERAATLLRYGGLATLGGLIEATKILQAICSSLPEHPILLVLDWIEAIAAGVCRILEGLIESDLEMRRIWTQVDLILTLMRGVIRSGILSDPAGFDAMDDDDFRDWLLRHGASAMTVDSAFVRGIYSLAFAFEDGDPDRPRLSAGVAVRGLLRMFFTYRGALFWKMRAGMGDVVFAPFYEVLKRRGVRFRFFHRLAGLKIAEPDRPGERPYVEALEIDVLAKVRGGGEYQPLVDVRGLPCWPAEPLYGQLAYGKRLQREGRDFESPWDPRKVERKVLRVREDFDFVVLGVGLGAVPYVAQEILVRDPRWRDMVRNVRTVATQAFQLWLREDLDALGWKTPPINYTGFVAPFDTWADMRHLIEEEGWSEPPRSIVYFCNTLEAAEAPPGPGGEAGAAFVAGMRAEVRRNVERYLRYDLAHLWPNAVDPSGEFRYELLAGPPGRDPASPPAGGAALFDSQYWSANVTPSQRYVLALPGSARHRLSPLDNTYDNLTIAGDWTACGLNYGCVEAAVISGRLAAHALSRFPRLEDIVGYDHP